MSEFNRQFSNLPIYSTQPCVKDCHERKVGCRSSCQRYINYQKALEEYKAKNTPKRYCAFEFAVRDGTKHNKRKKMRRKQESKFYNEVIKPQEDERMVNLNIAIEESRIALK